MKNFSTLLCFAWVLALCFAAHSYGALTRQNNLLGKFFVSSVTGEVTCVSDGRILELKKGDTIMARGAIVETKEGASATLVFSNGTGVYADEKTRFEVEKFDQEFFAPNNNLKVEPSNSSTLVALSTGRVVVSTPRLLSGTTMVYKTAHAAVGIRGEKILIEADEKQTHVAMISGNATVNVRNPDGTFVSIGKRVTTGQEAFVKYTIGGGRDGGLVLSDQAMPDSAPATQAAAPQPVLSGNAITSDAEAVVVKLIGSARAKLPAESNETPVAEGAKLPKGTTLFTDETAELHLQAFDGAIATLRPNSSLQIEKLSITRDGSVITKQTAVLALKTGTVISTIDPAKSDINDYGVRTPKGLATARGTSFAVSIEGEDGFTIAATADTVTFLTPAGVSYSIAAGNVTITPPGGEPQPPVPLATAIATHTGLVEVVRTALNTVSDVVQNNVGALPPTSATDLITKVASTASAVLPAEASGIATKVVTAVTWPSSATATMAAAAAASVSGAVAAAVPDQASQIATAAALAAPSQAIAVAAAAAKSAPAQAAQIASAVTQTLVQTDSLGNVTPAAVQTASALASAVTSSVPNQAAPVASAVMQALAQSAPLTPPLATAQAASTIASAVTAAAPSQAVPVAATMMRTLTQTPSFGEATSQIVAQTAATLASAVTLVVPPQAQEVATAVMQLLVQSNPGASPAATTQAAGLIAAAVSQSAPDQAAAISQSVATAANQPVAAVQLSAAQSSQQASQIAQQVTQINQSANSASQQGNAATSAIAQAGAGTSSPGSNSGGANPPSSTVAQNSSNSGNGAGPAAGAPSSTDEGGSNTSTSIIITQFDPSEVAELTAELEAAQTAQAGVQFTPSSGSGSDTGSNSGGIGPGGNPPPGSPPTVDPIPTVPSTPPVDRTASNSNLADA